MNDDQKVTCGCGGEVYVVNSIGLNPEFSRCKCKGCGASTLWRDTEAEALAAFRLATRADADALLREARTILNDNADNVENLKDRIDAYFNRGQL